VGDDLRFARLVRGRCRAGVEALVRRTGVLLVPLLAALVDGLEERIVEALDDDDQLFLLRQRGARRQSQRRGGQSECDLLHGFLPYLASRENSPAPILSMTELEASPGADPLAVASIQPMEQVLPMHARDLGVRAFLLAVHCLVKQWRKSVDRSGLRHSRIKRSSPPNFRLTTLRS